VTVFEDLDDPNPPLADPSQRHAVAERARQLTRRRRVRGLATTAIIMLVALSATALFVDRYGDTVRTVGSPPSAPRQVLQFRLVLAEQTNDCPAPATERVIPSDTQVLLAFPSAHSCLRVGPALLSVDTVQSFELSSGYPTGSALITLTGSDAARFDELAATNLGQRLALVMFDQVLISPTLQNAQYNGRLQVTGLPLTLLDRMRKVLAPAISHCGFLYTLRSLSGETRLGGCSGSLLAAKPAALTVRQGMTFNILSVTETNGRPNMRAPTSSNPSVVAVTRVYGQGGNGEYRATGIGSATLITSSIVCNGGPVDSTATTPPGVPPARICPVVQVTVVP
jgi:hypothetical protein